MVSYKFPFFFNLVEKSSFTVKKKFQSVAKMASTVYETEICGAESTNRENRHIDSLSVWPFGGAQFSAFWDGNSLQDDGTEAKPAFGCISLS